MNATPLLSRILATLREHGLEAVLIGNAAAAMHGAPVTTLDFDFMFRDTPLNLRKLKRVAADLDAMILRPFYPVSKFYRMVDDATGLQADFMPVIHGVRSFQGLKARAVRKSVSGCPVLVATLADIIASKEAAGRAGSRGPARLEADPGRFGGDRIEPPTADQRRPTEEGAPNMTTRRTTSPTRRPAAARRRALAALPAESDRQLEELIRRRIALPLEQRMNFLRRRLPGGGSCL